MKRSMGHVVFAVALVGILAGAFPVRAAADCSTASLITRVTAVRDDVIFGVSQGYNKCSVDASVLYLNSAIDALRAGDRATARTRVSAASLCLCKLTREINPATGTVYRTVGGKIDLAAWHHTVPAQTLGHDICDEIQAILACLSS